MKATIAQLAQLPGVWRGGDLENAVHATHATGHAALDRELPGAGWPAGTLSEVLHDAVGIGEVTFLLGALAGASRDGRLVAWIDPPHLPYAPALAQGGLALERCLVVRPASREDALWTAEQALKSGACGAVLLWCEADYAAQRRLQMAAEAGRAMAVMFRSTAAAAASTPAHLRVVLSRERGVLEARIPKRRGPPVVTPIEIPGVSPLAAHAPRASAPPRGRRILPASTAAVLHLVSR